jgi:MFS family permease
MDLQAIRRGRWAVASLFLANGFVMGAWAPQIPLLLPRHAITEGILGLMILLLGVGAVGSMLFVGKLIAAYGSRRVALTFGFMIAPALPLIVLAPNLWLLAPCMVWFGGTMGSMDVAMNANAVEVERRMDQSIMSSSHGFWSVGGFVGGAIGGLAIAHFGAQAQALGVGLIAFVILILARPHLIDEPRLTAPLGADRSKTAMFPPVPGLYLLGTLALFTMIAEGGVLDWAALYLSRTMDSSVARSGLAFGFFSGAMALMRFFGDGVRDRFGAVGTLRLSALVAASGMAVAAVAPNDIVAIAGFAFSGLGVANMVPILFSAAGGYPGISAHAGIATVTMMGYSGILIAPSGIGFAAQTIGYRPTYGMLVVLLLTVALLAGRAATADRITAAKSGA